MRICKTVIRPTFPYGCRTWTTNEAEEEIVQVWERKVLRKIFDGKKSDDKKSKCKDSRTVMEK